MDAAQLIIEGKGYLGIEFGSTRIKAVLVDKSGNVLASGGHSWENRYEDGVWTYSLNDICDEWSREFYFEGRRRMDLIRFNRYGGNVNYNWQWKGGTKEGRNFSEHLNIFAIPTNELTSNKNLIQNPGY